MQIIPLKDQECEFHLNQSSRGFQRNYASAEKSPRPVRNRLLLQGNPAARNSVAHDHWNLGFVWQGPRHLYRGGLTSACFPSVSALRREYGRGPFTQPSVGVILGGGFSSRSHCRPLHEGTESRLRRYGESGVDCRNLNLRRPP
jgi:hypothetical protein